LLGSVSDLRQDPLRYSLDMMRSYGDVVRMRFLFWPAYLVTHPDGIKHVLQENYRNYRKDHSIYRMLRPLLGRGLVTNDGDSWLHQRRLIQPAFHHRQLAALSQLMSEEALAMQGRWQGILGDGQPLDIASEMSHLSLRIAGRALFSTSSDTEMKSVDQAVATVNDIFATVLSAPYPLLHLFLRSRRRLQGARQALDRQIHTLITQRRQQNGARKDLLSLLLTARDEETGERMSDQQIHDEVITLFMAGHETVALLLTWTWYLLSQHPDVEQQLHRELETVLGGQQPTVEHLPALPYTRSVLEEALRLYPPAWIFARRAIADDEIGGYTIPAKSLVILCPYMTHRHPALWKDPEVFDPLRFTPEHSAGRPSYAYFPFGGGPRLCIGNHFALMEATLIIATLGQRYRLRLISGHTIEPTALFSLCPRGGMPMTLHRISQSLS
jgi:cytochrome P450